MVPWTFGAELLQRGFCYPRRHRDTSGKLHWRRGAGVTWEMNEPVCDGLRTSILGRIQMCAPEVFERYGDDMADGYARIHHESEERASAARDGGPATVGSRYWENWAAYTQEAQWMMEQQPAEPVGAPGHA